MSSQVVLTQGTTPATPSSGKNSFYIKADKAAYMVDDAAAETVFARLASVVAGAVVFGTAVAGVLAQDSTLFWDNTNKRLGVGATNPAVALSVKGIDSVTTAIVQNVRSDASGHGAFIQYTDDTTYNYAIGTEGNGNLAAYSGRFPGTVGTLRLTLTQTGNLIIPTSVTTPVVDSGSTGSVSIKTNNGTEQFRVLHRNAAVNTIQVSGNSTGASPQLIVQGSDTNVSFIFSTQAAGSVDFYTDSTNARQFQIIHTASAARNITVTGSAAGNPTIDVTGGSLGVTPATVFASSIQVAGTVRVDNQATTGTRTATFTATNKPGTATTSPDKWLPLNLDGTVHFIPAFL